MKKILTVSIAACFIITVMVITSAQQAHSATLGIGASGWYTWWQPKPDTKTVEKDSSLMYGPQLLLQFAPQWSVSSVFIFGEFEYKEESSSAMDITRYDSDTTLTYSINSYLRLFGGFKFMGFDYEMGNHYGYGPGFGVGLVIPTVENLYCAFNISGMYLWAEQEDDGNKMDYTEYGINSSVAMVYMIPSSSVSLSIGGRYFYFQIEPDEIYNFYQKEKHHFYGITASAMYMISL
ncbi:MAG TPA: hypothetical protein PKY31_02780 [Spirochaetota bacterium]|nr:hypothetical protein [Spirochaetota bacterium]